MKKVYVQLNDNDEVVAKIKVTHSDLLDTSRYVDVTDDELKNKLGSRKIKFDKKTERLVDEGDRAMPFFGDNPLVDLEQRVAELEKKVKK